MLRRLSYLLILLPLLLLVPTGTQGQTTAQRCFETLDMLNGIIQETACPFSQPQPTKMKSTSKLSQVVRWSPAFKGEGDLHRYLECYAVEDGRYNAIAKKYMPVIETAADSFEMPKTVLACLLFRESRFEMGAVSPTGAIGLGQHLPSTMDHLTNLLKPEKSSKIQDFKDIASRTISENVLHRKITPEQAAKDKKFAETKLRNREFRLAWEDYYETLNTKKCTKRYPKLTQVSLRKGCISHVERTITPAKIKADPEVAIGATALYFQTILAHFKQTLKNAPKVENGDNQSPDYNLMLAAAGSYNMGPGAAADILKNVKPATPKAWVEALTKSNEETAAHILSIKNCIEPATASSGLAWKGPIGNANYDCDARRPAGEPPVTLDKGAVNELPLKYRSNFKTASFSTTKHGAKKDTAEEKKTPKKPDVKADAKSEKKPASVPNIKPEKKSEKDQKTKESKTSTSKGRKT